MARQVNWLAVLSVLLGLAACAPIEQASVSRTASATPPTRPTATVALAPSLGPAATPTNVPAGWAVLDTPYFSIAYPPGWSVLMPNPNAADALYLITSDNSKSQTVRVILYQRLQNPSSIGMSPYCPGPSQQGLARVTLAGLAMAYQPATGVGSFMRAWDFANALGTHFRLDAADAQDSTAVQVQDDSILATFRPYNSDPWIC